MKRPKTLRRRKFLEAATGAVAAIPFVSCSRGSSPWRFFTAEEGATLSAVCERIIPADQDPGAKWAGVVNFIDKQLLRHLKKFQSTYRDGLAAIEQTARKRHGKGFTELAAAQQDELLALLEKNKAPANIWKNLSPPMFFDLLVSHTMQGFYGTPRHGGNREAISWRMLGVPEPPIRGRLHYELPQKS